MQWITRERPKIDRIACPWLISRFIDKTPEFLYAPTGDVLRIAQENGAIPYDVPGVEFSHVGEHCSFDAFLGKYHLEGDPALRQLALIVRGADTSRLDLTLQSGGLYAISLGLSHLYALACRGAISGGGQRNLGFELRRTITTWPAAHALLLLIIMLIGSR